MTNLRASEVFERERGRLTAIAYGMLGSVMEAEDIVQDVYLRWLEVDVDTIDSPPAFLTTMTTRTSINHLKSARVRRETYVGPWLPEPMVTGFDDPADLVAEAEALSMAVLTALEQLTPTERAVLLLREVFDADYTEIADIVGKSPANCRQIAVRARNKASVSDRRSPATDPVIEQGILDAYLEALSAGDLEALSRVFAEDVVLWSDGGGRARAARHPLHGAIRVARHLIGVRPQTPQGTEVRAVRVNGDPGFAGVLDGRCIGLISFDVAEGRVIGVRAILNPDKLARVAI